MVIGALTIFHSIYSHIFKPFRFVSFSFMIFRSALNGFCCLMLVLLLFVSVFKKFRIWFYMTFPDSVTSYFKKQSIEKLCLSCNDCCVQVFQFSFKSLTIKDALLVLRNNLFFNPVLFLNKPTTYTMYRI